jgi:fibronectin type 3 domain-containing protein
MDMRLFTTFLLVACTACASDSGDDDTSGGGAPAAPTNLQVTEAAGGGHLTWTDNSDNEEHFMVQRKVDGDAAFEEISTQPFNATQYHDADVTSGTTYVYKVTAMNADGEADSNDVTFAAP